MDLRAQGRGVCTGKLESKASRSDPRRLEKEGERPRGSVCPPFFVIRMVPWVSFMKSSRVSNCLGSLLFHLKVAYRKGHGVHTPIFCSVEKYGLMFKEMNRAVQFGYSAKASKLMLSPPK